MKMKYLYLALTILGVIAPYYFFVPFFMEPDATVQLFLQSVVANAPAAGFTADLLVTCLVFWTFMFVERKRDAKHAPHPALFIALNLGIGLSCALPAYLYIRERKRS